MFRNKKLVLQCLWNINKDSKIANRFLSTLFEAKPSLVKFCQNTFDVPKHRIESMMLLYPKLQKIEESQIEDVMSVLDTYGVKKDNILCQPSILNFHPFTIDNRWQVLLEIGFTDINLKLLSKYLKITTKYTLADLKMKKILPEDCNIWGNLIKCFSSWPDVQNKMNKNKFHISDSQTLDSIRMMFLERFLELSIGMPKETFRHNLEKYVSLKHRSLRGVCELIHFLKNQLKVDNEKLVSHGFICMLNLKNLQMMLNEVKELGGNDIKEVLAKTPTLMKKNYKELLKIKKIMKEENVSEADQNRNILVFSFNSETVRNRIREFRKLEKLEGLNENPRIGDFIYSRTKVNERLHLLEKINKKCTSLHMLVTNQKTFDRFSQGFGDKTKGVDTIRALTKIFSPLFPKEQVKQELQRHPYWTHSPLPSIISVVDHLKGIFTLEEIFGNLQLLLYSLDDVKKYTNMILNARKNKTKDDIKEIFGLDSSSLTNFQILSLVTYFLEKDHNFSCSGIWNKHNPSDLKFVAPK